MRSSTTGMRLPSALALPICPWTRNFSNSLRRPAQSQRRMLVGSGVGEVLHRPLLPPQGAPQPSQPP